MTQANPTHDAPRQLDPEEMVAAVADLAADRKALDIVQLDLRGMIGYADYFIICTGKNPVSCAAADQCHDVGVCDGATGACSNPAKLDGSGCNDGNACTTSDQCDGNGSCSGTMITCPGADQCHTTRWRFGALGDRFRLDRLVT